MVISSACWWSWPHRFRRPRSPWAFPAPVPRRRSGR
nr:MAG TPA: hypothetical protein [Caudoviricetes sp.]